MANAKKDFMKKVCILIDTREQKNKYIIDKLDEYGVKYESRKLDYGDYSFTADGRDFSLSCVIERKANANEIYGNIMQDRARIEKEFYCASNLAKQFTLFLENIESWERLKEYKVPEWEQKMLPQRQVIDIGRHIYSTLRAWGSENRYNFNVEFISDPKTTADKILETFYYYWHNFKELTRVRK